MPTIDPGSINWLAVAVAALATFMLGGAWYTALFGTLWQKLHGYDEATVKELQRKRPPAMFFGTMIVCYFVVAVVMAILIQWTGVTSAGGGATVGFFVWTGFCFAVGLTGAIAVHFPLQAFLIDAAYQFIYCLGTGALLGAWQ